MSESPAPRRLQFGIGTLLLAMTFLAPWFLLYTYARQRRPDLANGLFLGVMAFCLFMATLVIVSRFVAARIKPNRGANYNRAINRSAQASLPFAMAAWMLWNLAARGAVGNALVGRSLFVPVSLAIAGLAAIAIALGIRGLLQLRGDHETPGRVQAWCGIVAGVASFFCTLIPLLGYWMIWPFYLW